ncbi:MAG: patatin-like phospholipase family protein [Candidatus Obscuribacterales bacterium]|nr:patatin-like phospholipase family protein [Candidatus Obscuribacterales bacterium]
MRSIGIFISVLLTILLSVPAANAQRFVQTSAANATEAQQLKRDITGKPKIGLVLGGGGARGAAEVGVLKVLAKEGIKFDYVVGTSIGSVVGGFYCLGATPEQMEEQFETGKVMRHFMSVPLPFRIVIAPITMIPRLFGSKSYDGLYSGTTFRKYLVGKMSAHDQNIENLKPTFAAVCLNVIDGKPYMIRSGNLGLAMEASCAVPELRKPIEMDGQLFCDGGVVCNLPVKQCRQLGADFVIAVNIDEPFKPIPLHDLTKVGSMVKRMLTWELHDMDEPQAMMADVDIHPDTTGISLISTKKKDAKRGVIAGEEAARAALPEIRKKLAEIGITYSAPAAAAGSAN